MAEKKEKSNVLGELCMKFRSEKSFHGYHPSILKSGVQKYARRAKVKNGMWCLVEMDLFSLLERDGAALNDYLFKHTEKTSVKIKQHAKRLRTNMINRLVVMMSEEINISAWWMPLKIFKLYQEWVENRGNSSSQKFLVDMYLYLTSQQMIRLISDLKSVYLLPPDYVKPAQMASLTQIHNNIQGLYPGIYSDQAKIGNLSWKLNKSKYSAEVWPVVKGIIYNLEKGNDNVFYWMKKLCDFERHEWAQKNSKKKFAFKYKYFGLVWDILNGFIDQNNEYEFVRKTICALQEFYKMMGHQEKPIYLYHALLLIVRRDEIDWNLKAPCIDTPIGDVEMLYKDHLSGGKMPMDDYIIDLHTRGGKPNGNCLENFALEGAFIENENVNFLCQDYRDIYIKLKQELDFYHSRGRSLQCIQTIS